jgi:hypothetical protein
MRALADRYSDLSWKHNGLLAALEKWYATHSAIRRLRVVSSAGYLTVFVLIEPTSDGDEVLPIWLANRRRWLSDLRVLTRRSVRLELTFSDEFTQGKVSEDIELITELSWRDPWSLS